MAEICVLCPGHFPMRVALELKTIRLDFLRGGSESAAWQVGFAAWQLISAWQVGSATWQVGSAAWQVESPRGRLDLRVAG